MQIASRLQLSVLARPAIRRLTFRIGAAIERCAITDGSVHDSGTTQIVRLLLDRQLIAGGVQIALIGTAFAHIVAGIGGGHLCDHQTVALLLQAKRRHTTTCGLIAIDIGIYADLTCMLEVSGAPSARSQTTSV